MQKRIFISLLSLVMIFAMLPVRAFAVSVEDTGTIALKVGGYGFRWGASGFEENEELPGEYQAGTDWKLPETMYIAFKEAIPDETFIWVTAEVADGNVWGCSGKGNGVNKILAFSFVNRTTQWEQPGRDIKGNSITVGANENHATSYLSEFPTVKDVTVRVYQTDELVTTENLRFLNLTDKKPLAEQVIPIRNNEGVKTDITCAFVSNVALELSAMKAGDTLSATAIVSEGTLGVKSVAVTWKDAYGAAVNAGSKVKAGKYTATFVVKPDENYLLDDDTIYTLNDEILTPVEGKPTKTFTVEAAGEGKTQISNIAVTLTAPKVGDEELSATAICNTEGVQAVNVTWEPKTAPVIAGTYTAAFTVTLDENYSLSDDVTYTLNGEPLTSETGELKKTFMVIPSSTLSVKAGDKEQITFDAAKTSYIVNVASDVEFVTVTTDGTIAVSGKDVSEDKGVVMLADAGRVSTITVTIGGTDYIVKVSRAKAVENITNKDISIKNAASVENGKASAEVKADDALAAIINAAIGDINYVSIDTSATVSGSTEVKSAEVTLPATVTEALHKTMISESGTAQKGVSAEIKTNVGTVTLPAEAITQAMSDNNDGVEAVSLKLVIEKKDEGTSGALTEAAAIYEVSIKNERNQIIPVSNLEIGSEIILAFPLSDCINTDTDKPILAYVKNASATTAAEKYERLVVSEVKDGMIIGKTNHLSAFAIVPEAAFEEPASDVIVTWEAVDENDNTYYGGKLTIKNLDKTKTYLVTYDNANAVAGSGVVPRVGTVVRGTAEVVLSCQPSSRVIIWVVFDGKTINTKKYAMEPVYWNADYNENSSEDNNLGIRADQINDNNKKFEEMDKA